MEVVPGYSRRLDNSVNAIQSSANRENLPVLYPGPGTYYRRGMNAERGMSKQCWCGEPSDNFTSGSATNPGRLYYCCAKGYHKRHLFKWVDECLVEEVEDIKSVMA
ncbi:hypothetical protein F2Q68_00015029 [Brassica cretica]|uniref:GRF-type domain-containing protein n=2 Tax=Brassica cretica TaxID=69181 RepID=A0A8S9HFQ4_BRACR|nr:hypothetical protein F2Q68_00015029 [Brassica cretica]